MTYILAELGINHNGDTAILTAMVAAAARAKVDAIKFQIGDPNEYVDRNYERYTETPWGTLPYREYRQRLELSDTQLIGASKQARSMGLECVVSPLDALTVIRMERLGIDWAAYKVASPKIVDTALLAVMCATHRPIIVSTGQCTLEELDRTIQFIEQRSPHRPAILHCVSKYPCPIEDLNLTMIGTLKARYPNNTIGYSGHEVAPWPTEQAVTMGAEIVERHLTLDRSMWGSDQAASLEPEAFASLVSHIRGIDAAKGTGIKDTSPVPNAFKFRYSNALFASNAHSPKA